MYPPNGTAHDEEKSIDAECGIDKICFRGKNTLYFFLGTAIMVRNNRDRIKN